MIWRLLVGAVVVVALSGCATIQRNIRQNLVDRCAQAGYGPAHPQHEECVVNTAALDRRQAQQDAIAAFTLGAAAGAYANQNPVATPEPAGREYWLTRQWYVDRRLHCQYSDNSVQIIPVGPCPPTVVR